MKAILLVLTSVIMVGCGTYKSNEIWRRSICNEIVDDGERTRCEEDATRPENEYKQDVEKATQG